LQIISQRKVATVGKDGFGEYVFRRLNEANVKTNFIKVLKHKPTSVIFVSRSKATPDFIPYREADTEIFEDQISTDVLRQTKILHTTCFALSKNPAQSTILKKAEEGYDLGCKLSIDLNYSNKIWNSREEALRVIKLYCKFNPLIKISEDDVSRLFEKSITHDQLFNFFHDLGVDLVCLTLGSKGVRLSQKNKNIIELPAIKIEKVLDATGAGDAFWSGFLFAYINNKSIKDCLEIALKLAALKLQNVGRLPDNINILSKLL
jgi:fructokinase